MVYIRYWLSLIHILLENGLTLSPYNFITILIATGVCALVAFLYYRFCYDSFKKLLHRQKLARMILENKWYVADTIQDSGFFTCLLYTSSSNTSITDGNGNYSIAGAAYGVFADKNCTKQLATLTTDENGNTDVVEVKAGTVYIKELSAPAGYKVDKTIYPLTIKAGETATLNVSDTPKVTDTLIELFKIDMICKTTYCSVT